MSCLGILEEQSVSCGWYLFNSYVIQHLSHNNQTL